MRETTKVPLLIGSLATMLLASSGAAQTEPLNPPSLAEMAAIVDAVHAFRVHRDGEAPVIDACALGTMAHADVAPLLKGVARRALVGSWSPGCRSERPASAGRERLDFLSVVFVSDSTRLPEARGPVYDVVVQTTLHAGTYGEVFRLREFAHGIGEPPRWRVFRYKWVYSLGHDRLGP